MIDPLMKVDLRIYMDGQLDQEVLDHKDQHHPSLVLVQQLVVVAAVVVAALVDPKIALPLLVAVAPNLEVLCHQLSYIPKTYYGLPYNSHSLKAPVTSV